MKSHQPAQSVEEAPPSRNTFTAIQDILSSHIEDSGKHQGNDQVKKSVTFPASPQQQSESVGDAYPQATIQLGQDIDTLRETLLLPTSFSTTDRPIRTRCT